MQTTGNCLSKLADKGKLKLTAKCCQILTLNIVKISFFHGYLHFKLYPSSLQQRGEGEEFNTDNVALKVKLVALKRESCNTRNQRVKTSHFEKTTALLSNAPSAPRGKPQLLFLRGTPRHPPAEMQVPLQATWAGRKEKEPPHSRVPSLVILRVAEPAASGRHFQSLHAPLSRLTGPPAPQISKNTHSETSATHRACSDGRYLVPTD